MASNFVDLNQAAEMLGVTPDTLVEMRSQGEIFGFRDGSSWKFKMDELERVAQERGVVLGGGADSEFDLSSESELDLSKPLFGDEDALAPDEADGSSLGDLLKEEPLDLDQSLSARSDSDNVDSLLVNEDAPTLSDTVGSGAVIGDLDNPESDLQLSIDDDDDVLTSPPTLSGGVGDSSILGDLDVDVSGKSSILGDIDLASADKGGSDVRLAPGETDSDVTVVPDSGDLLNDPSASGIGVSDTPGTGELDELELAPSDDDELSLSADTGSGGLELSPGSGTGDLDLTPSAGSGTGDLDLTSSSGTGDLELSAGSGTGDLELDLDSGSLELDDGLEDDSDLVLGDSSALGSDVTLGAGDTGINLTGAADSGLSLEEDPLDISGGPISSLELPDEDEIALEGAADPDEATQLKQDEAFLLSPGGEGLDDEDSASQVIALDNSEQFDENAATMLGDDVFGGAGLEAQVTEQPLGSLDGGNMSAGDMLGGGGELGQLEAAPGAAMGMGGTDFDAASATAAPMMEAPREAPYNIYNVLSLMLITGVLALGGMLMMDVVRNMWSWDNDGVRISTSIMDGLLSALGIRVQ